MSFGLAVGDLAYGEETNCGVAFSNQESHQNEIIALRFHNLTIGDLIATRLDIPIVNTLAHGSLL